MNAAQYEALRRIELMVLRIQRAQLARLKHDFHMLNLTAWSNFSAAHIKGGQVRLYYLRFAYYQRRK